MAALLYPVIVQALDTRLALIIGNGGYQGDASLSNPVNDATDLAAALKNRLGFEVIHRTNLTVKEMRSEIEQFGQQLRGMGLFYYAGHGMQVGDENYLIPIGAEPALFNSHYNLDENTLKISFILKTMQDAGNEVNIIILDAYHKNPLDRERLVGLKHAQSLIAYAGRDGEVGLEGIYAASLIDEINHNPNLSILQLFTRVRAAVRDKTGKLQSPGFYSELDQDFCLVGECRHSELIYKLLKWWQPLFILVIAFGLIWLAWRQKWVNAVVFAWPEYRATKIEQIRYALMMQKKPYQQRQEEKKGKLFQFQIVTVDVRGKIIKRTPKKARYQTEYLGKGVTLEMVYIPEGSFLMGSPETRRYNDENPQHKVMLEGFYMGKYPVTQAQYEVIMGNNPSWFKGKNRPVEWVSWHDAVEFCQRLSEMTCITYSLPSEAQWEYAARAGTRTAFYFGETITSELANYNHNHRKTTQVGSFPPNAFGLYEMHGNVWEWCADPWHENYEGAPTDGSVWEGEDPYRLLRGGSWYDFPSLCNCVIRSRLTSDFRLNSVGFRLVAFSAI